MLNAFFLFSFFFPVGVTGGPFSLSQANLVHDSGVRRVFKDKSRNIVTFQGV